MGTLCDECLELIINNLTRDEIVVLEFLLKSKCFNSHLCMDKTKIMPQANLTEFKFQMAMSRLEVVGLVNRVTNGRLYKYYITSSGKRLLEIYTESVKKQLSIK